MISSYFLTKFCKFWFNTSVDPIAQEIYPTPTLNLTFSLNLHWSQRQSKWTSKVENLDPCLGMSEQEYDHRSFRMISKSFVFSGKAAIKSLLQEPGEEIGTH